MARTDKMRQSQLELQAGQSGESATQRSHESLMNTRHRNADRVESARQFDSSVEQRNLDRWQRQWEQRREERARRDKEREVNQANKRRTTNFGTEGRAEGDPMVTGNRQADAANELRREQFTQSQAQQQSQFEQSQAQQQEQFDTRTDLQAASQGLQRSNPRLDALQQEMAGRQREQMGAGIEQTGRRGFVPTPEAQQQSAQRAELAEREMQAKELNARANFQRAATAYNKLGIEAQAAKTAAARKELQAQQKQVREDLMQPIKSASGRLDRFMEGKHTQADMQTLRALLSKVPPVGNARALHDEVQSGEIGPRVTQFLTEQVAAKAIEFAYATGRLPDGDLVDLSSAGMQEFSQRAVEARQLLQPETVAGKLFTGDETFNKEQVGKIKRGYAGHLEMVNKLAALLVMKQQPTGPSAALSAPQEPTHEQRRADPTQPATPAERAGQITPGEAARRAGQSYDPGQLPTKQPHQPGQRPRDQGVRGGVSGNLPYGV